MKRSTSSREFSKDQCKVKVNRTISPELESLKTPATTSSSSSTSPSSVRTFLKRKDTKQAGANDVDKHLASNQHNTQWHRFLRENLNLDYAILYNNKQATELISRCESEIVYNNGNLAQVRIFGKWIDIPRKQVAFGDAGLTYTFSGNTVPAIPWTPLLLEMRNDVSRMCGYDFNFVLVNRYKDGKDYMGEHKDDEKDLCPKYPIASLSLGQKRDFVFKHQDSRGKNAKRKIDKLTIELESGSLLLMNAPTNSFWYHSLPKRPKLLGMRLNFTFRKMVPSMCKKAKQSEGSV